MICLGRSYCDTISLVAEAASDWLVGHCPVCYCHVVLRNNAETCFHSLWIGTELGLFAGKGNEIGTLIVRILCGF